MQKGHACRQAGFAGIFVLLGILIIVGITAGAFYVGKQVAAPKPQPQNQSVTSPVTPSSVPTASPAPTGAGASREPTGSAETANWKTYTDKMNRFSFKYPVEFSIKEDTGGSGYAFPTFYVGLEDSKEEFRFEVGPKDNVGLFEHFKSNKTENFNGIPWTVVIASEYCDAGECGLTAPGYYLLKGNYYVGVYEFSKVSGSKTLQKILSTFKFLK